VTARAGSVASSRLRRLAQAAPPAPEPEEHCELCGTPIAPEHRHLLHLDSRELACACRACALLFDRPGAGGGRYRAVGDRRLRLDDLRLGDPMWEELRLPVDMAFFFRDSRAGRVQAFYPSPMGPTESLLALDAWEAVEAANPVLAGMEPDVEALLVDRVRGARRHWLVPIDDCYRLVALIRTRWRGFTGGREVWDGLEEFWADLDRRSRPASRDDGPRSSAAAAAGRE
jgi:Family of unknown function (DUF5947)